jgi:hypothetical protein
MPLSVGRLSLRAYKYNEFDERDGAAMVKTDSIIYNSLIFK